MNSKTLIVRFPAAVCILLILFVGRGLGQETKLKWFGHAAFSITTPAAELKLLKVAFREMKPGETLTFQGSRIK